MLYTFYFFLFIFISLHSFVTFSAYQEEWRLGGSLDCVQRPPCTCPQHHPFPQPYYAVGAEMVRKTDSPALSLQSTQGSLTLITVSNYTMVNSMQIKSREI